MALRYVHFTRVVADMVVYKKEEVASFTIAGISEFRSILLETRRAKSGI